MVRPGLGRYGGGWLAPAASADKAALAALALAARRWKLRCCDEYFNLLPSQREEHAEVSCL